MGVGRDSARPASFRRPRITRRRDDSGHYLARTRREADRAFSGPGDRAVMHDRIEQSGSRDPGDRVRFASRLVLIRLERREHLARPVLNRRLRIRTGRVMYDSGPPHQGAVGVIKDPGLKPTRGNELSNLNGAAFDDAAPVPTPVIREPLARALGNQLE